MTTQELTPEEQAAKVKESEDAIAKAIQDSFIREWADISADFNKSNKRMVDTNIQQSILDYLSSYFKTPLTNMEEAFGLLNENNLHLNVLPIKKEFWSYEFSIEILQKIESRTYSINLKTDFTITPL